MINPFYFNGAVLYSENVLVKKTGYLVPGISPFPLLQKRGLSNLAMPHSTNSWTGHIISQFFFSSFNIYFFHIKALSCSSWFEESAIYMLNSQFPESQDFIFLSLKVIVRNTERTPSFLMKSYIFNIELKMLNENLSNGVHISVVQRTAWRQRWTFLKHSLHFHLERHCQNF